MKKFLIILLAPVLMTACYMGPQGELIGFKNVRTGSNPIRTE